MKLKHLSLFLLSACALLGSPAAVAAAQNLVESTAAAKRGDAETQFILGSYYFDGRGVPKNMKEAQNWYRKSAEQGYAPAQYNMGAFYEGGIVVPASRSEALKWYRKAAAQKHENALKALQRLKP